MVTSAKGGFVFCLARTLLEVSPVRASTFCVPSKTSCKLRTVSAASARSGVIQSTRRPLSSPCAITGPNQAASVLPKPVGAWIKPLFPTA